jgi:glycosyltransferase A (GT-A) superfamily protein (DUF2064 family)
MKLKTGVAVFARVPGSGGKSRLAATWGRDRTDTFYAHCLHCAAAWLQAGSVYATPYWALTGAGSRDVHFGKDIRILEQIDSGLGERMADISFQLMEHHPFWCLVGTDIPHMPPLSTLQLGNRLERSDFVFGPSCDGGFWLIASRKTLSPEVFSQVGYSLPDTLEQLIKCICREIPDCSIDTGLPILTDIDTEDDLLALKGGLDAGDFTLNPAQQELQQWLLSIEGGSSI